MNLNPQVNTAIMKRNLRELPQIFHLIRSVGIKTWELFFLIRIGRGTDVEDLSPKGIGKCVQLSLRRIVLRCHEPLR